MKVLALKDLPDGTPAGRIVDMTAEAAEILMLPGVDSVRPVSDDEARAAETPTRRRSGYLRRDLRAS